MAPSGAGLSRLGSLLLWLLAALGWAGPGVTVAIDSQCASVDDVFSAAISSGTPQVEVTLGPGCHKLFRNFVCTPIRNSLVVTGSESEASFWDTDFDLYQFSLEAGIVLTLRNLVLSRTLVFTAFNANQQPSSEGSSALQPAIFHMRPGSRIILQNVTIQTRCATLAVLRSSSGLQQASNGPSSSTRPPLLVSNMTIGAVALVNVTVGCELSWDATNPVDLYIHTAAMLSSFITASSALSVRATLNLAENLTLPRLAAPAVSSESPGQREGLVTTDTIIRGAGNGSALTYIDANYTESWLTVRWPARLTLRGLLLTRLRTKIVAPGDGNALLAGALPLSFVTSGGADSRYFEDVTLLVPQYEVTEMTYWCVMMSVGTQELKAVADFLRAYVRYFDFNVLDSGRLLLERVETVTNIFIRVTLTSIAPPGVPFEPFEPLGQPPDGAEAYQHVRPPLFMSSSGSDWADAVAPVLPHDTWSSPPQAAAGSAAASSSAGSSSGGGGKASELPAVVLINGTVKLQRSDVRTPGGGTRVARRSVVVTSLRQNCGGGEPSCRAVLDMGGLMNAIRLDGPNTTIVFMGITLRNFFSTLTASNLGTATADQNTIAAFFIFDRTRVHVSFESVTVELQADAFTALYRLITLKPRAGAGGDVGLISVSDTLIQLASFQFGGARGRFVNFTLVPGEVPVVEAPPSGRDSADGGGGAGGGDNTVPIVVGCVVGGAVVLIVVAAGFVILRLRRRARPAEQAKAPGNGLDAAAEDGVAKATTPAAAAAGHKRRDSRSTSRSAGADLSLEGSGVSTCEAFAGEASQLKGVGGDEKVDGGSAASAAAATAAAAAGKHACGREQGSEEGSPQCTTMTVSELASSEAVATHPPTLALSLAGASGQMPRRAFSVARSVPEDDELGAAEASLDSSRADPNSRESACSTSACGYGRRLLADAMTSGEAGRPGMTTAAVLRTASRVPPALLDSLGDGGTRGSGGAGSGSGGGGQGTAGAPLSGTSARRMSRMPSGGRTHYYGVGEGGRPMGLRVRAALGRSPSCPSRSTPSSSGGPSSTLPAPLPAILVPPLSPCVSLPSNGSAGSVSGGAARSRADRVAHAYNCQRCHLRTAPTTGHRREISNPTLVPSSGGGGAAGAAVELVGGESHSTQLMATGGTLDPMSGQNGFNDDSSSPGASTSISKVPEPASEVQRLIQELSTQGTDQLVILEPIGQGGYGMVYRGVWRNLDVAVKTVLFQDRANLASPQASCTPNNHIVQTTVIEEGEEDAHKEGSRPGSAIMQCHPSPLPPPSAAAIAMVGANGCGLGLAAAPGRDASGGGGGPGASTHNFALASQQAANSGSLPSVHVGAGVTAAQGPLGVASQQRAVLEAAVSCSVAHPNVVATYHYDITPVRPSGVMCSGGLLISDGSYLRGCGPGAGPMAGMGANSDWKLYLVQEFCDGGSLANALDARAFHDPVGMPNLALTLCALADIARGMAHIHSRSIVHGDLNPTNILLRSANGSNGGIVPMWNRVPLGAGAPHSGGGSGSSTPGGGNISAAANLRHELGVTMVAKVADFGLCGMLAPGKRHISNALRGTPFYTAPETVETGTLTKASDVYSFGVIAWEVYTGRPPFRHVPDQGFVRDESFPRLPPHVPATFAKMALACVNQDPNVRPTFDQILERLTSLQSKLAVSLQQRLSRLVANNGTLLGAASPLGAPTGASTPHGSMTPTMGGGILGTATGPGFFSPYSGGSEHGVPGMPAGPPMGVQPSSMPPMQVGGVLSGFGMGMGMGMGLVPSGLGSLVANRSPQVFAVGGAMPNVSLSTPCMVPAVAPEVTAEVGGR